MKTIIKIVFVLLISTFSVRAQENSLPQVGKPMPDFELTDVHFFSKKKVTIGDFKGKWLFLDFWFKNCTACIYSFPKINKYQNKFKDNIQYFLVGLNDKRQNRGIEELFLQLRNKYNLSIPVAYDSVLVKKWGVYSMPHIFVIDPNGIVVAITNGADLSENKIQELIDGKKTPIYNKIVDKSVFDPLLFKDVDSTILVKSTLAKCRNELGTYVPIDAFISRPSFKVKGFRISATTLSTLYFISELGFSPMYIGSNNKLYGKYNPEPILEVKDSTNFRWKDRLEEYSPGWFNYSMVVNPSLANKDFMMSVLSRDLKTYFGYDAKISDRKVKVWKLIASPGAKELLVSKFKHLKNTFHSDSTFGSGYLGFEMRNGTMNDLYNRIVIFNSETTPIRLFYNETGITDKIDIAIWASMNNIDEIRRELRKYKLDLIIEDKELPSLVISDPEPVKAGSGRVLHTN